MKKITSLILACLMLLSLAVIPVSAEAPASGVTFSADDSYATSSALSAAPRTIEAWVKVDADAPDTRLGIIVGSYVSGSYGSTMFGLEIRKNGNPYLYWRAGSSSSVTANFSDVDLRTGEWLHVAVVSTTADAKCYINGELRQTVENTFADIEAGTLSAYMLGGDYRTENSQYLKNTALGSVAIYSDSRSAEQIAADYAAVDYTESTLIGAYDLSVSGNNRLKDYSAKGNHLVYTNSADSTKNETYITMTDGMMFDNADGTYYVENDLTAVPRTIEAEVYFSATYDPTARGGVILGSYGSETECFNLEVYTNGRIRYYWADSEGVAHAVYFAADLYRGAWTHIAVTYDEATRTATCYVNGEYLSETVVDGDIPAPNSITGFVLGGDARSGNAQYFKGNLRSVALYSDVRTAEEIAADVIAYGTDDLILHYDLSEYKYTDRPATVTDLAGNSDAVYEPIWLDSEEIETEYAYSFAVVGDTQKLNYYYPDDFHYIYDWIVANKEEKNIQFVFGLGDITEVSNTDEWDRAIAGFEQLSAAGIPYSVVRGNHDYQKVSVDTKKTFNEAMTGTSYDAAIADKRMTEGELENTYQTLTVGETNYLILTLDYGPTDEELAWASELCETYSDHKVIVTTHAYMYRDGTTLDENDTAAPSKSDSASNNGDGVWEKFVKQHENIVLVLSGHDPSAYIVTRKENGVNGNTVTQMLIDAQTEEVNRGAMGMVTMFYFSADGKSIEVEHYSTVRDQYFLKDNQFTMTWNELVGDVDLDYTVDITDVISAVYAVVNGKELKRADMNGDGQVTLIDAIRIMKVAVK